MNRNWFVLFVPLLLLMASQVGAVDYELPDVNGQMQSLDQYQGKWVIVNYWATWCGTCMKELPDLVSMHENNRDKDIVVVGVNFESIGNDQLKAFVAEQSIPYPVLRSEPVPVTALGKVPALPTTYIIDPDGKVVAGEVGLVSRQNLEDYIAGKKAEKVSANRNSSDGDIGTVAMYQ
ncbi:MAG: TlpA disulfide reductase family protein [Pseudomonadota bacterium]